uniref:Uncharacterized protein n=1 Tax=Stomoxys calcitrans TaxID=35570 RepID=A0A1I8QB87_STOCA
MATNSASAVASISSTLWYGFGAVASPPMMAALATMATSTVKVAASALNSSITTGTIALLSERHHQQQQQQHHPPLAAPPQQQAYQQHSLAGNNTSRVAASVDPASGSNTNTSLGYPHNSNSNSNNFTSFLLPTHMNSNGSYMGSGGGVDGSMLLTDSASSANTFLSSSGNNTLVDGFMVDHLPLQLITSTTPKVNLDIEIDIQLLTSDYDGTT